MQELFRNVLTASFYGGIVILAVLLLRLVLKKAPRKFVCLLWILAFIRLLMPFEIQSPMSLQPQADPVEQIQQSNAAIMDNQMFLPSPVLELEPVEQLQDQLVFTAPQAAPAPEISTQEVPQETTPSHAIAWGTVIAWGWLAVASGFGLYTLVSYLRLRRRVRFAVKIPGGWECDRIETAFILGFIRPRIYIPMGMSRENRRYILSHERTHLEKGDHWLKLIGFLALSVHWFNPLVWLAYFLLCKDIELACDERVVRFMELEERKAYSAALLNCSTNRAHFAACPVAFGEVSVKERIKSVLNYRKPGFWISLLSVIAIGFVAVCLMTTPVDETRAPGAADSLQGESDAALPSGEEGGYAAGLDESQIVYVCQQALEALGAQESYHVVTTFSQTSTSKHFGEGNSAAHVYKCGENAMNVYDGEAYAVGNNLLFEGQSYDYYGDAWVVSGNVTSSNPNRWMQSYTPDRKTITFPEGTGILDGDTVAFAAEWTEANPFEQQYSGIFTFTFHEDGSIASLRREYTYQVSEADGGGEVHYVQTATVEETPADIYAQMQTIAENAVTSEELELYRIRSQQVSEIPSNKTEYDRDFALGAGQMGWTFMDGEWFFKFGADNVTQTGCRLVVEYSGAYRNNTVSSGSVKSGPEYFIERLEDGVWTTVAPTAQTISPIPEAVLSAGSSQSINWVNNYGELPYGFYRIGNYYTFTAANGETDTKVCYAKFRLYDPNQDALLDRCRAAIDAVLNSTSYHIYSFDWMTEFDYEYYLCREVWRNGNDYLEITSYPLRSNTAEYRSVSGSMWRHGKYYGLTWADEPVTSDIIEWWVGVDGYMDDSGFDLWTLDFEWYDAKVELVYQEGNAIHILETYDYSDQYQYKELTLTFDSTGNLKGIVKAYLPSLSCGQSEKLIEDELTVFDTSAREIGVMIEQQDVDTPMAFSYAEDVDNNPSAQTSGFKNTTASPINTIPDAIARADRECTLPPLMQFECGYCQTQTYYDDETGIWKVYMYWWQNDISQTIYMTDDGITQMIVSTE